MNDDDVYDHSGGPGSPWMTVSPPLSSTSIEGSSGTRPMYPDFSFLNHFFASAYLQDLMASSMKSKIGGEFWLLKE